MAKRWGIKPNRSLRENARLIVPLMIDEFLARRERVVNHPRLKNDLHRMRLSGKELRYAMEVFEPGFADEFSVCLERLKQLLEVMGRIHDCDVNIPRLQSYLKEIRSFNKLCADRHDKIPTAALARLLRQQMTLRKESFVSATRMLDLFEQQQFRSTVIRSMESENIVKE